MKKLLLSILTATSAFTCMASTLTPEQALKRATSTPATRAATIDSRDFDLSYSTVTESGLPAVYIFQGSKDTGFLVVSADDVAYPLLGYSDSGSFDPENIPEAMKGWLNEYARQIEYASSRGISMQSSLREAGNDYPVISPLVKTKWDQEKPYNDECPRINGVRCVTGCVATAMAQVMNFHKYPERGEGTVIIELKETDDPVSLRLSDRAFDWDNMLDSYVDGKYNKTQSSAVAYLMKACGYSVDMSYSTNESGAAAFYVGKALINNFNYNKNISYEERKYYTSADWQEMVYKELEARRPVLYSGHSEGGGHSFVCDGYNGEGYFHINWGWGGTSDGYFLLQSLNPDDLGIGGGTGGGFSFYQSIVKGVQPETESTQANTVLYQTGNLTGAKISTSKIALRCSGDNSGWFNMSYRDIMVNIGVIIQSLDNPAAKQQEVVGYTGANNYLRNVKIRSMYGLTSFTFAFPTDLPNGKYRVTVATQDASSANIPWQPVRHEGGLSNSAIVTKTANRYTIEYQSPKMLSVDSAEFLSELHFGSLSKLKVSFSNRTDTELTQTIAPILTGENNAFFEGDGIAVTLLPGESITKEVFVEFEADDDYIPSALPIQLNLGFVDVSTETQLEFSKTVEMKPKTNYNIAIEEFQIDGASFSMDGDRKVYDVTDPGNIDVSALVKCNNGYFGSAINAFVFPERGGTSLTYAAMTPVVTISQGEEQKISGNIMFEQATPGTTYMIALFTMGENPTQIKKTYCLFKVNTSGVSSVEDEDVISLSANTASKTITASSANGIRSITITDLTGKSNTRHFGNGEETVSIETAGLSRGIYIITAIDGKGNHRTIKANL